MQNYLYLPGSAGRGPDQYRLVAAGGQRIPRLKTRLLCGSLQL